MANEERVEVLLEGLDENNISSILRKYGEVIQVLEQVKELEAELKEKAKIYLKERDWPNYKDPRSKISITIETVKKQTVDKTQLKIMLTDPQMAQVIQTRTFEKVTIVTPEIRKRLKKHAK